MWILTWKNHKKWTKLVRDIRGIDLIKIETTQSVFKILHVILGIDSKSHFHLIVGSQFSIKASKIIWRKTSEFGHQKIRFQELHEIPKISCKTFENWLSCFNLMRSIPRISRTKIQAILFIFCGFYRFSIHI